MTMRFVVAALAAILAIPGRWQNRSRAWAPNKPEALRGVVRAHARREHSDVASRRLATPSRRRARSWFRNAGSAYAAPRRPSIGFAATSPPATGGSTFETA
jgi:hypothetical protein